MIAMVGRSVPIVIEGEGRIEVPTPGENITGFGPVLVLEVVMLCEALESCD